MNENLRALLNDLPEKPPRSKLEPHVETIRLLRGKRYTYQEIARFLKEHLALAVAPSTIHDFVRVRRARVKTASDSHHVLTDPRPEPSPTVAAGTVQQKIAALKSRSPNSNQNKPLFVYDGDEPLKLLKRKPGDNEKS